MGGVSFVEVLILHELWAGERLVLETALPKYLREDAQLPFLLLLGKLKRLFGVLVVSLELFSSSARSPWWAGTFHSWPDWRQSP